MRKTLFTSSGQDCVAEEGVAGEEQALGATEGGGKEYGRSKQTPTRKLDFSVWFPDYD